MAAVDTRHVNRDSLLLMAPVLFEGHGEPVRTKVRNLSAGGMMLEGDFEVERGTRLTVELRNIGKVKGSVAWAQGSRVGVAFDSEIDPKLARSKVSASGGETPTYAKPALDAPRLDDPLRKYHRL